MNIEEIENKRCEIRQESVSQMSFDDNTFDIISAFETVYFWPDFSNDLNEVNRILNDDGIFMICNEALPKENDERQKEFIELLDCSIFSKNELVSYLNNADFQISKRLLMNQKILSLVKILHGFVLLQKNSNEF